MPKLPIISASSAIKAFEKDGWVIQRKARGSHIIMKKEGWQTTLSVPNHKELDRGLLRALIRDAGLTVDKFVKLLGK
ncbi:type II toxin-antitoxin system HicA family toxin [bacterium]|nr:type II toxin-antitoxin system HicA family toxin [bacterium]